MHLQVKRAGLFIRQGKAAFVRGEFKSENLYYGERGAGEQKSRTLQPRIYRGWRFLRGYVVYLSTCGVYNISCRMDAICLAFLLQLDLRRSMVKDDDKCSLYLSFSNPFPSTAVQLCSPFSPWTGAKKLDFLRHFLPFCVFHLSWAFVFSAACTSMCSHFAPFFLE